MDLSKNQQWMLKPSVMTVSCGTIYLLILKLCPSLSFYLQKIKRIFTAGKTGRHLLSQAKLTTLWVIQTDTHVSCMPGTALRHATCVGLLPRVHNVHLIWWNTQTQVEGYSQNTCLRLLNAAKTMKDKSWRTVPD